MNKRAKGARRPLILLSSALLALASSSAMALGLGELRVLSRPGQPLLAEIPVISADPAELENLRVGLASAVTFERVGLQRPEGLVSELQFELTRNAQGRAVVRVTSQAPVETPSLSFLVEADWGQGRLVREYSALVDAPSSALAVAEPAIVAPQGALSDAIAREAEPAPMLEPAVPVMPAPAPASSATPVPRAQATAPAAAAVSPAVDGRLTVQAGQTLSEIAQQVVRSQGVSRNRAMIALLRANPEAFIRGNVNLVRQGAVLRVPDAAALAAVDAAEANAMVREHIAQWRQSRTLPQPAAVAETSGPGAPAAAPATGNDARLEIAPAVASSAADAGTTTGTGDGNEGEMLANEQLRQAREDVASRDAEIDELKQRVADLEKLQQQQQALVALKDTELASAQQRLAQDNASREGGTPWYWLGLPVLLLVAAGTWLARRRKPSPLPPLSRGSDEAGMLEPSLASGAGLDALAERGSWQDYGLAGHEEVAGDEADAVPEAGIDADAMPAPGDDLAATALEQDAAAEVQPQPVFEVDPVPDYARQAEQQPQFRGVFDYPAAAAVDPVQPLAGDADVDAAGDTAATAVPAASTADSGLRGAGRDRLELAIAYLDLGDAQTARTLLLDVAESEEPQLRAEARELLARLG